MVDDAASQPLIIGCIADDITGATDLAGALVAAGLSTEIRFGVPDDADGKNAAEEAQAVVVALKSRALVADEAAALTRSAGRWLRSHGARSLYLKYCSTFDSTSEGNIGPTADALADLVRAEQIVHSPAYPANGRTVYQGHLFVGEDLLSESGMRDHPLTPMTDPLLTRVLAAQTTHEVGLLTLACIRSGVPAVAGRLSALRSAGVRHVIADALDEDDLQTVADATLDEDLWCGGAAFAQALARCRRESIEAPTGERIPDGPTAFLVGSASQASTEQTARFARTGHVWVLDAQALDEPDALANRVVGWATNILRGESVLVTADTSADGQRQARARHGDAAAGIIEQTLGLVAAGLVDGGARKVVVAGGETSGAVADALGLRDVRVGPAIATGVPWLLSSTPDLAIAFKSGNFGPPTLFTDLATGHPAAATTPGTQR